MINFVKKYLLPELLFLLSCISVIAQEKGNYVGPLQVGSYSGNADYHYTIVNQDTIFDGPFLMQRSSLESLLDKEDASFLFKGSFSNGIPNRKWQFQFGEFQTDSQSKVVDFEYRVLISGIQEEGIGILANGNPNGEWIYEVSKIKDSETEKTLFRSAITFENGIPQQNFQIENENSVLLGRFLRNGLAQDEWSSYASDAIDDTESWYFEDGLLRKIQIVRDGVSKEILMFRNTQSEHKTINLDNKYVELLNIMATSNGNSNVLDGGALDLLKQNNAYYQKMNDVLLALGPSEFKPNFKVKVPYYELDTTQVALLKEISVDFKNAKSISDGLLKNSHLNIIKRSDQDALFNYNATSIISEKYLKPIEKLVTCYDSGILEYVTVEKLVQGLWPSGKPSISLEVAIDSSTTTKTFSLPNKDDFDFEGNDLKAVSQLAAYARLSLEKIAKTLSEELTNEQRLQTLNGLEEELIAMNKSLVNQIDSASQTIPDKYKTPLKQIKMLADISLSKYASIKSPEDKLTYGNDLKNCFGQLISLSGTLIMLPSKSEEIQALYQDSIWNPFMATVMDEGVKKRIINTYTKILVPHFLELVGATIDCDQAEQLTNQIIQTNNRMVQLREEDTRKLERKLRKEKSPEEIMKLLHQLVTVKEDKNEN